MQHLLISSRSLQTEISLPGKLMSFFPSNSSGPFNHVKSSLLGSTSDSNINKYSTISKIPLIALNFSEVTDKKTHSPQTSEKTIIAPKVKDRTHNVTEKVTQVSPKVSFVDNGGLCGIYCAKMSHFFPRSCLKLSVSAF